MAAELLNCEKMAVIQIFFRSGSIFFRDVWGLPGSHEVPGAFKGTQ